MGEIPDADLNAADRVVGAASAMLQTTARMSPRERTEVRRILARNSALFRRGLVWVNLFDRILVVGAFLLLFATLATLGGFPMWLLVALVIAGTLTLGISAIHIYRFALQALDVAIGAFVVAREGGDNANER